MDNFIFVSYNRADHIVDSTQVINDSNYRWSTSDGTAQFIIPGVTEFGWYRIGPIIAKSGLAIL